MKHPWVSALIVLWACLSGCSSSSAPAGDDAGTGADSGAVPPPPTGAYPCRADGDGKTTAVFVNRCGSALEVRGGDIEGATVEVGAFVCRDLGAADEALSAKR